MYPMAEAGRGICRSFDAGEQIGPSLRAGGIDVTVEALSLEVWKALDRSVVPVVAPAAHGRQYGRSGNGFPVSLGGVLDVAVGMVD
jgi:hypothetical protein